VQRGFAPLHAPMGDCRGALRCARDDPRPRFTPSRNLFIIIPAEFLFDKEGFQGVADAESSL